MAWLPASLLKTHRRLSKCATTMRVRFLYERRRYVTMVKIRHGLATLNSNNSVVYGQKHTQLPWLQIQKSLLFVRLFKAAHNLTSWPSG